MSTSQLCRDQLMRILAKLADRPEHAERVAVRRAVNGQPNGYEPTSQESIMAKAKTEYRELLPEELAALRRFAEEFGKHWKSKLAFDYWYNARIYRSRITGQAYPELHGLRNELGPNWLDQYKLPKS